MKLYSPMIAYKYARKGQGTYYMKEAYCPRCHDSYVVPVRETYHKCVDCKVRMRYRWKCIGSKIDLEEYLKSPVKMKDVGRTPKYPRRKR